MDKQKRSVIQLTRKDLGEIADVANIRGGAGIIITRDDQGACVEIDRQALRMWIRRVIDGGDI